MIIPLQLPVRAGAGSLRRAYRNPYVALLVALCWALGAALGAQAQAPPRYEQWRLQWAEEFDSVATDTVALAQRWRFDYPWGRTLSGWEVQYYTPDQLHVADGTLRLRAEQRAKPLPYKGKKLRYDSGMLFSQPPPDTLQPVRCPDQQGFSYGLFEIRCRQSRDAASWPAFWLFGGAPDEVDIFEANADVFASTTHINPNDYWRSASRKTVSCSCGYFSTQPADLHNRFHVYSLAWLPGELIFYFDGVPIRRETRYAPLGCSMALIVNLAMTSWAKVAQDSMEIDYIRVYRPTVERMASEWMHQGPQTDLEYAPRKVPLGLADQTSRQYWELTADSASASALMLSLVRNDNPSAIVYALAAQQYLDAALGAGGGRNPAGTAQPRRGPASAVAGAGVARRPRLGAGVLGPERAATPDLDQPLAAGGLRGGTAGGGLPALAALVCAGFRALAAAGIYQRGQATALIFAEV